MDKPMSLLHSQRGVALPVALLALVFISMIAVSLMTILTTETKLAGRNLRGAQALNTAEAGVAEAVSRIEKGDIPDNNNPRMVAQIFLTPLGSVPVLGPDSVALATAQPSGGWLRYSTGNRSAEALTVHYKTDAAKTLIYKYDPTKNPPIQTLTGSPIYVITATGHKGIDHRQVVTEVIQRPFNVNIKAAVAAGVDVKFTGNAVVCGYNHRDDTPANTGDIGRAGLGGCNENPLINHWEVASDNRTGIWATGNIQTGGGGQSFGTPAEQQGQIGFYAGPWEALGMTQAAFAQWIGAPQSVAPANLNGIVYLDNNATAQDQSSDFAFNGGTGEGMLYVDGDLTLNSTFTYRGLVYVEGDLKLNGSAWILGGVIVRGKSELKNNGAATTLYSHDAIIQNITKHRSRMVTLSWREGN